MTFSAILLALWPLSLFVICKNTRLHSPCLYVKRFRLLRLDRERNLVYDNRYGVVQLLAVGGWINRWIHWGRRSGVTRRLRSTCSLFPVQKSKYIRVA